MPTAGLSRREWLERASRRAAAIALGSLFGAAGGQDDAITARRNATVPSGAYPYTLGAAHPWVPTWDDHEVENDYADDRSPSGLVPAAFLRRAQEAWLADRLATSVRRWRLLGQGSQISPARVPAAGEGRLNRDGWDGYPAARRRLLEAIERAVSPDVLCLGGDVHRNVAAQLRRVADDAGSPVVASEFVCASVSSRSAAPPRLAPMLAAHPDILHARADERGCALLEIGPRLARCEFRTTPTPAGDGARLSTRARYAVDAGRAGVRAD